MPRFTRSIRLGALASLVVVGLALTACAGSASAPGESGATTSMEPASVNLQLRFTPSVQFAGSYLADADGYYAEQALTVALTPGGASIAVEPLLMQGTADIGLSSPGTTARAVAEGAGLTIIAAGYQTSAGAIISLATNPVKSIDDLVGKRIGVVSSNTSVAQFLAANGIDQSKVTLVPIQGDASPLISGQVDAMYGLTTNQAIALEAQGHAPVVLRFADNGMDSLDLTYTVSTASLSDPARREILVRFLMAEIRGWDAAIADSAAAAQIVVSGYAKDQGLDLAKQTAQARAQVTLVAPDPDTKVLSMDADRIAATLATLKAQSIPADPALFDESLITEAYERLAR